MSTPPVTDTLARFVSATDLSTMSGKTLANAKMHILDTLGVALAGVSTEVAGIALEYCQGLGAAAEASIWGSRAQASVTTAAFANGLLAHALDYDDWDAFIHVGHPSSMTVGAALPLAEQIGATAGNVGVTFGLTVIVNVAMVAHWPAAEVNV